MFLLLQVRQMAQSALITVVKRELLDNNTIENEICPTIEHLSYMSADEHLRNANISVSFLRFIPSFYLFIYLFFIVDDRRLDIKKL